MKIYKKKVKFIEQMESVECGLACFAMIADFYSVKVSLNDLRNLYPAPREGFSFLNLQEIAENYSFNVDAYEVSIEELKHIALPCIIQWGNNHFVVLEEINKNYNIIVDPNRGKIKIKQEDFEKKYSGFALAFEFLATAKNNVVKEKQESIILKYFNQHKGMFFALVLISIVIQGLMTVIPLSTKWVTDNAFTNGDISKLDTFGWLMVIFSFSFICMSILRGVCIAILQKSLDSSIMNDFMKKMFYLPYSFFDNRSSGDLLFRANSAVFIRDIISTTMITIFIDLLLIVTYTVVMINFSVQLTLLLFLLSIVLAVMLFVTSNIVRKMTKKNIQDKINTQSVLTENMYNIVDIKSLGLEKKRLSLWSNNFAKELVSSKKLNIFQAVIHTITGFFQVTIPLLILWVGGHYLLKGEITLGTLIAFSSIAGSYITPIISISNNYTELISLESYFSRIRDVLRSKDEQEKESVQVKNKSIKGDIEFENVFFKYNRFSDYTLKELNFTIKQGEKVAIVGPSGSGKSSISKLLLALYKVSEGRILINNQDINDYDYYSLRTSIGTVLQESKLFSGSISDNISMSKDSHDDFKVIDAAEKAGILEDIMNFPMGFETIISESGNNFSGGQRQRLLIARALYQEPSAIIFDEATSHLDFFTERHIENTLKQLHITQIIIAHRLRTIQNADKIIYLENGSIKEIGTHEQLLENKSYYYNLYSR
ncbi:peptidase domain-containing ABC transporter [Bacillus toyonensis]|uniref:Peptidase C39 n=1 Tax=Bacillus toyonensis TaxID=155322 RepID=A0AB36SPL0_9BACI|nr:peptidase domain-containing ABC transporter [Bacillus toyonensis]MCU4969223.1 peptidase domain-containing ABC transporter [Bacillus toyonensis]PDZ33678.1 peptidase C39 [Bacillus toyonensis]PEI49337.1 peptidase C39 [Bacillus toyonensis]PEJ12251.1 peptidase C39 [Bacillus toyonensis]PEJ86636.1 peptidase C39 [Bacillus toyonensis]